MRTPSARWAVCMTALAVLLGAVGPAAAGYVDAVLNDSPVAYYRLGEASGPTAGNLGTTGATNDGTYAGSPTYGVAGALHHDADTAISFPGTTSTYVDINPFSGFPSSAVSVELWMKSTGSGDGIFSYAVPGSDNHVLLYHQASLYLFISSGTPSGVNVGDGAWHHVAGTWRDSDDRLELYVDGVRRFTETRPGGARLDGGALILGQEQDAVGGSFQSSQAYAGVLDEVALYDRALRSDEVELHHFLQTPYTGPPVSSANVTATAPTSWSVPQSGPLPTTILSSPNGADFEPAIDGQYVYVSDGVLMATVRENERSGLHGIVEVDHDTDFSGSRTNLAVATSRIGANSELHISVATAFFPFDAGWSGGHVTGGGSVLASGGALPVTASRTATGLYSVSIHGAHAPASGLLFAEGAQNGYAYAGAAPLDDGSWLISTRTNAQGFTSFANHALSFIYLPYTSMGLLAARVAADGSLINSKGEFLLTRESLGTYRLTIPDEAPVDGVLLLTSSGLLTSGDLTAPANMVLSYEADDGDFLIQMHDVPGAALTDGEFVFAYMPFDNPPIFYIPEPTTLALLGLGGLGMLVRRRRRG